MQASQNPESFVPSSRLARFMQLLGVVGVGITIAGVVVDPTRAWPNVLLGGYYVLGVGVSATLFLAFAAVSNAGWTAVIRRIPEALSQSVFAGGLWIVVSLLGVHSIYEWSHADVVASDPVLQAKSAWLNSEFFAIRTILYVLLWGGCTALILRALREQRATTDVAPTRTMRKRGGAFIVVFALTFWLASMDWIMSLEPHWYSTIFGVYAFSGNFLAALATITIMTIMLKRGGWMGSAVRSSHVHDLGKLMFAFSTFWMYIWFSQYVLIWYANIPEETVYFLRRETAGWASFTLLNIAFNWVIPFVALLPAAAKQHEGLLLRISIVILIGHWIDLFWMIFPSSMPDGPTIGIWELGPLMAGVAVVYVMAVRSLRTGPVVPQNDPYMIESLSYHS